MIIRCYSPRTILLSKYIHIATITYTTSGSYYYIQSRLNKYLHRVLLINLINNKFNKEDSILLNL